MNRLLIVLVALVAVGGGYRLYASRKPIPNVAFKAAKAESPVNFVDLRGAKSHLVVAFLFAGCPASKMVSEILKAEYAKDPKYAVAAITVGDPASVVSSFGLPFPVVDAREATDPFAMNDLISRVGGGSMGKVVGGTTFVLDSRLRIVKEFHEEEVRDLVPALAKL